MLDFKAISKMNTDEFAEYISSIRLDILPITEQQLLHMANGFILCRDLMKYDLPEETINELFYACLLGNKVRALESVLN